MSCVSSVFQLLPRQSRASFRFQPRREDLAHSKLGQSGPSPPSSCMGTFRSRLPSLLLLLTLLLGACIAAKDYYDLLSVPKGASESQIKRAYRKLALQYHPVSPSPQMNNLWHPVLCLRLTALMQDKVTGSTAEKEAAAKKFAEISSGELGGVRGLVTCPSLL